MVRPGFLIFLCFCGFPLSSFGQQSLAFDESMNPPLMLNAQGDTLGLAWLGGFNQPQFGEVDWDLDGENDLWVFDRMGNVVLPLVRSGNSWVYRPDLKPQLPGIRNWCLPFDANGDGFPDLIGYNINGLQAWLHRGTQASSSTWQAYGSPLKTDFGFGPSAFFISQSDLPGLADVDGDGDMDVLTFNFLGSCLEWHRNLSQEQYGHSDSLIFTLETGNWGKFREGASLDDLQLQDSCGQGGNLPGGNRHAGSSLLAKDLNQDGLTDLILGDAGDNRLAIMLNGGTAQQAEMVFAQAGFPQGFGSGAFSMEVFLGAFSADLNNDNLWDVLVAPNTDSDALDSGQVVGFLQVTDPNPPKFQAQEYHYFNEQVLDLGSNCRPALGDLNGDGQADFLLGHGGVNQGPASWHLYLSTPGSQGSAFRKSTLVGLNAPPNSFDLSPSLGDLDNDGDLDLVFGRRQGDLFWLENTGTVQQAVFSGNPQSLGISIAAGYSAPCLFDLNQDGYLDLLIGAADGQLSYVPHNGASGAPFYSSNALVSSWANVQVTDPLVGNQGHAVPHLYQGSQGVELLVGSYRGTLYHYQNVSESNAQLVTQSAGFLDVGLYAAPISLDRNSDGLLDLVVGNGRGGLQFFDGKVGNLAIEKPTFETHGAAYVYPNPLKGDAVLMLYPEAQSGWRCMDLSGRVLGAGSAWDPQFPSQLTSGTYLMEWLDALGATHQRLWVKQE